MQVMKVVGTEEETIIKPAIREAKNNNILAVVLIVPMLFCQGHHDKFDAVLAMYHDQGLIPLSISYR